MNNRIKNVMIKYFLLFLMLSVSISKAQSLNDFLTSTLLGKGFKEIEQTYGLKKGALKDIPSYFEVGECQYEGLTFKVNVFFREGECKGYGLWKSQIRNKDKNGRLKHRDDAEIYDVFQLILRKLIAAYGQAPRVKFEAIGCGCGCASGPLSQTYSWVNEKYALVFMFHDSVSTQSITLRHYRRDEKNGEFTGAEELVFLEKLYSNESGKLPDVWPSVERRMKDPQENKILDEDVNQKRPERNPLRSSSPKKPYNQEIVARSASEKSNLPWIIVGVLLAGFLAIALKVFKDKSSS